MRSDLVTKKTLEEKNPNLVTSSVLTKNNCVFLASTSRAWVEPETREAWRDLATQQWLRGVEVIKCLDYITNVVQM